MDPYKGSTPLGMTDFKGMTLTMTPLRSTEYYYNIKVYIKISEIMNL